MVLLRTTPGWLCTSAAFISSTSQLLAILSPYGNSHYATHDEGPVQLHSIPIHFQCTFRCELDLCAFNPVWFFSFLVQTRSMRIECIFNAHPMPSVDRPLHSQIVQFKVCLRHFYLLNSHSPPKKFSVQCNVPHSILRC